MHQYKIEVYNYTEAGSIGDIFTTRYADNPEQARLICAEFDNQYFVDEEGKRGMKMYKVNLHILCYKYCADKEAFFAQFKA